MPEEHTEHTPQVYVNPEFTQDEISEMVADVGGTKKAAEICGVTPASVRNWKNIGKPMNDIYRVRLAGAATLPDRFPNIKATIIRSTDDATAGVLIVSDDVDAIKRKIEELNLHDF